MLAIELFVVVVLTLVNGVLALSELAVVSSRPARLRALAERRVGGAPAAVALNADPGRFLSTVQIGITLVGIISGAFSGATLAHRLALWFQGVGLREGFAEPVAFVLVVSAITYASLIVGELVPKQVALRAPERFACAVAPAMLVLSRIAAPVVWLLSISGRLVLRLIGQSGGSESKVTDDEIRTLVAEAETAGVIEPEERRMIAGVMRLGDRAVGGVMTPRREVRMVDLSEGPDSVRRTLQDSPFAVMPAHAGNADEPVGIIQSRDVMAALLSGRPFDPQALVREAPTVLDSADAIDMIEVLRASPVHIGLVHDEYGHFQGILTSTDILAAIAGVFRSGEAEHEPDAVQRGDGSWLVSGLMPADEFADMLAVSLPESRDYHTAAGFALDVLGRMPATGDRFEALGWRFEVVDMDGRRIDKLLVSPLEDPAKPASAAA